MPQAGAILCRHFALRTRDYGPPGAPKRIVSVRGGNVRRASRRRVSRARGVAPRRGVSSAPSWPGAPCVLGAAELTAHPRSRPSSMPANHAGCSRRTRRGDAARAMVRHAGYRRGLEPRHGACVARVRIAKAPVSAGVATDTRRGSTGGEISSLRQTPEHSESTA